MMKEGNILLRTPEITDVDQLMSWENNPELWRLSGTIVPFNRFQIEQYVLNSSSEIASSGQIRFIIMKESIPVGAVDLFDYHFIHRRAGVGILIADEQERRHGTASSALRILDRYAKEVLCLHQLHCSIESNNSASIALFEKAGYQQCGIRKDWLLTGSGWEDEILYQKIF